MFVFAQILSVISLCVLSIGMIQKNKKNILLFNAISNILDLTIYLLLNRYVGCLMAVGVTIRTILFTFLVDDKYKVLKRYFVIFFISYFIMITIFLWQDAKDILPLVNYSMMTFAFCEFKGKTIKIFYIFSSLLMIPYHILIKGYIVAIKSLIHLFFSITGLIISIKYEKQNENKLTDNQNES
jgi:hypothetical protein